MRKHLSLSLTVLLSAAFVATPPSASCHVYSSASCQVFSDAEGGVATKNGVASVADIPASYKGTPFKTFNVPCTIEAEDYDLGGEGVAFHWSDTKSGSYRSYRKDPVCISGSAGSQIVLGFTSDGDWTNYTVNVAQAGDYAVETLCSSGNGNGKYEFKVDGEVACRVQSVPNTGWDTYKSFTVKGLHLTAGKHVIQFYTYGGMNVDKFVLTRTGDLTGGGSQGDFNYTYPITQSYTYNPLFVGFPSQTYNSNFTSTLYTADPSAHVWTVNGQKELYVYASHDVEPSLGCDRMDRYHVFSTKDMVNWTDHGEMLNSADVLSQTGTGRDGFMWAPDCAYNPADGMYYFYFPHVSTKANASQTVWSTYVARSAEPAANFKVVGIIQGVPSTIDPCVFVDDDGQPYIYAGGVGKGCCVGKLKKDDWTKLDGAMTDVEGLTDFHEATWVFKRNGVYYLTYSDNHDPNLGGNHLVYATASSPMGPWTYKGVYMNPNGMDTAHGSVVEFNGKWYQFYHTSNYSGQQTLRSVCVDELTFAADGSINVVHNWGTPKGGTLPVLRSGETLHIEAEDYNDGGSHAAYYKRPSSWETFEAGNLHTTEMTQAQNGSTTVLNNLVGGEWVRYSLKIDRSSRYTFKVRLFKHGSGSASFKLGLDGSYFRSAETTVNGQADSWQTVEISNAELTEGEHFLEFRSYGGDIDLDWIEICPNAQKIPGTIEAEDYDDNADGYQGYSFKTPRTGNTYRRDQGVFIGTWSNGVTYIGNTNGGDWLNYTFTTEGGVFTVTCYVASQSDGKFHIEFDNGAQRSAVMAAPTGDWYSFKGYDVSNITLTPGTHIMTFHVDRDLNIDRFVFKKTGDLPPTGISQPEAAKAETKTCYNLLGQKVNPQSCHGIVIVNGRKMVVK